MLTSAVKGAKNPKGKREWGTPPAFTLATQATSWCNKKRSEHADIRKKVSEDVEPCNVRYKFVTKMTYDVSERGR